LIKKDWAGGSGLATIHLIDSNIFIPIVPNAKVFLNLPTQSFQDFSARDNVLSLKKLVKIRLYKWGKKA
jgi:hypothetical protein